MLTCNIVEREAQPALVVRGRVPLDGLPDFFGRAFGAVMAFLQERGLTPAGPPFGFYPSTPIDDVEVHAGFPVASALEGAGDVEATELPGGRTVVTVHVGPYDSMEQTYTELQAWMHAQGLSPAIGMWENYLSDPATEPSEAWRTEIVWPLVAQ